VTKILRGKRLTKSDLSDDGKFPVFHGGLEPLGYYGESNRSANTVMVINVGASAGTVGYSEVDFWSSDGCYCLEHTSTIIDRFMYFTLLCKEKLLQSKVRRAGIPTLDANVIQSLRIPVPPLEVQREIVRILDNFTEQVAELKDAIAAELAARKKQYEYYRDELLTFGDDVPLCPLGDVCTVQAGGTPSKKNNEYWENGTIKWLGSTVCKDKKTVDEVTDYISDAGFNNSSARMMKKDTTLIALVGATIGKVAFLPFEATINQNIAGIYPNDTEQLNPSYVYYACKMLYPQFVALTQGAKLAMANMSFVRGLKIPVPPIAEQNRIVDILDRFDTLCNDISAGLPAEIEARQKQYEYYRDKLLTFKELSA
jgi:type I restriction enzyme S subunit